MKEASLLRKIAQAKLDEVEQDLSSWSEELADSLVNWCEEEAERGEMECSLDDKDIVGLLSTDVSDDDMLTVSTRSAKLLENLGYEVTILYHKDQSLSEIKISWK